MKNKTWRYNPGDLVEWKRTHGYSRKTEKGIVVVILPRKEKGIADTANYEFASVLAEEIHLALSKSSGCPEKKELAKKLKKFFLASCYDRYLIWLPGEQDFRTPVKSVVEKSLKENSEDE